jgi:hypothetical protein
MEVHEGDGGAIPGRGGNWGWFPGGFGKALEGFQTSATLPVGWISEGETWRSALACRRWARLKQVQTMR